MAKMTDILSDSVSQLKSLYGESFHNPDVHRSIRKLNKRDLPRIIFGGSELGPIQITKEIEICISIIALEIKKQEQSMSMNYTDKEFVSLTRRAFGESLATIDLRDDSKIGAEKIYQNLKSKIKKIVNRNEEREYVYGCNLFSNRDIDPFSIGPVRFENRHDWLDRKVLEQDISSTSQKRILRSWNGEQLRKRKPSPESELESSILKAIDSCPYVCSIQTKSLGKEAGLEKAAMAARLAITSIALLWETPSRILEGFRLLQDSNSKQLVDLYFTPNTITLPGLRFSHMPHGPSISNEEWSEVVNNSPTHFEAAEEVISYYLCPTINRKRDKLVTVLAHSLLWFSEACREPMALISIVKFAASLDSLANGKGVEAICRMINARLQMPGSRSIFSGGPSVKSTIKKIYSQARSLTIHGANDKLGLDWSQTRSHAEWFARYSLISCLIWAHENPMENDPSKLQV